jgi:hypothetical protein
VSRIAADFKAENCSRFRLIDGHWIPEDIPRRFNAEQQVEVVEVIDTSVDPSIRQVQGHDHVTAMESDETIFTHTREFMDRVMTGLDDYFICRQKHCSMVYLSTHVLGDENYHYRCPACGELYRPWRQQPSYWKTNRVVVYYNTVHVLEDGAELAAGLSDGLAVNDQVLIFPVMWPDCNTELIIERFNMIELEVITAVHSVPPQDRLRYVRENLRDTPRPKRFLQYDFFPETKAYIDEVNRCQSKAKNAWKYDHIETDGYMGIKLGPEENLDEPWEFEEFLRAWVLAIWLADKAAAGNWSP